MWARVPATGSVAVARGRAPDDVEARSVRRSPRGRARPVRARPAIGLAHWPLTPLVTRRCASSIHAAPAHRPLDHRCPSGAGVPIYMEATGRATADGAELEPDF